MRIFTTSEARRKLNALIRLAQEGEEIVIAKRKKPVLRIVPLPQKNVQSSTE